MAVRETSRPYGDKPPGGYRKRRPEDYDRALCLLLQTDEALGDRLLPHDS